MGNSDEKQIKQWLQHAEAQLLQLNFAQGDARDALIHETKDALIRAEKVQPGTGAWLMACLHGRLNNPDQCRKWLDRARNKNTLPDPETLRTSPYLKSMHGESWFTEYL